MYAFDFALCYWCYGSYLSSIHEDGEMPDCIDCIGNDNSASLWNIMPCSCKAGLRTASSRDEKAWVGELLLGISR